MLPSGADIHVVAPSVHPLEPRRGLLDLCGRPFAVHHLAGFGFADSHLETLHAQRFYLFLDGLKASITAGFRWSATARGSSWFCTVGGARKSQNTVTSAAVHMPTIEASR